MTRTRRLWAGGLWTALAVIVATVGVVVLGPALGSGPSGSARLGVAESTQPGVPESTRPSGAGSPDSPTDAGSAPTVPVDGPTGPLGTWTPVWHDEFDGPAIDPAKWRSNRYGGTSDDGAFNPGIEGAFFSPRNVSVADGQAVFTVRTESATVGGVSYDCSSGVLSTEGLFDLLDGDYVEARIRIPKGEGLWPAFWTLPPGRWPPEIDIAEFINTAKRSQPTAVYHAFDHANPHGEYGDPAVDYRDSWHTYGMLRSAGRIVVYLDGVPYPDTITNITVDDLPQFMILNLSVLARHGDVAGAEMRIDWVRVWRPS